MVALVYRVLYVAGEHGDTGDHLSSTPSSSVIWHASSSTGWNDHIGTGHESYPMATPTALALMTAIKRHHSDSIIPFEGWSPSDELNSFMKDAGVTAFPRPSTEASVSGFAEIRPRPSEQRPGTSAERENLQKNKTERRAAE